MFVKRLLLLISIFSAVLYGAACAAPYLNPEHWWPVAVLALGFPLLLLLQVSITILWVFINRRYALIFLLMLLAGFQSIATVFAFNFSAPFVMAKAPGTIRVLNWNVARFIEWKRNNNKGSQTRQKMLSQIKKYNADILCLQEFFSATDTVYYNNLDYVSRELGYPYHYYSADNDGWQQYNGEIIFSRYPIIDSSMIRYPPPMMEDALITADIKIGSDTLRVATTHLQSVQFRKREYQSLEQIKRRDEEIVQASRNIVVKLRRGFILRSRQVALVKKFLATSPYPYIISGDFNDVPNSFTYRILRSKQQDAFLEKGTGVGRTYSGISPTLRIDYILPDKFFKVLQFKREVATLSDHYMLVTDLQFKK